MNPSSLPDYRWLLGPQAAAYLAEAADHPSPRRLFEREPHERARLIVEQLHLRERAREKFTRAGAMFFTRLGLEQASGERLARYKGSRFPAGEPVADLCCGLGGDLLGLAGRGPALGVERDPIAALLAARNAEVYEVEAEVYRADLQHLSPAHLPGWLHLDPDRRPAGRRTTRMELHEPPLAVLETWLAAARGGAVKLAPAAVVPESWQETMELEWIGHERQCRQLVAWSGELARSPGTRSATVLTGEEGAHRFELGLGEERAPERTSVLGAYLYEPHAAVLAAGLAGALAAARGLSEYLPGIPYFTGEAPLRDPLLAGFEVLAEFPYRPKKIKAWLRAREIGRLEVKKRGVEISPEQAQRELRVPGEERGTLLLSRRGKSLVAIAARRLVE